MLKNTLANIQGRSNLNSGFNKDSFLKHLKVIALQFSKEIGELIRQIDEQFQREKQVQSRGNSIRTSFMELNFSREREQRTSLFTTQNSQKEGKSTLMQQLKQKVFNPIPHSKSPDKLHSYRSQQEKNSNRKQNPEEFSKINLGSIDQGVRSKSPNKFNKETPSFYKNQSLTQKSFNSLSPRSNISKQNCLFSDEKSSVSFNFDFKYEFVKYKKFFLTNQKITTFDILLQVNKVVAGTTDGYLLIFSIDTPQSYIKTMSQLYLRGEITSIK